MINVHSHHFDSSASIVVMQTEPHTFEAIRQQYPGSLFSLGIHPWSAGEDDDAQLEQMKDILSVDAYRKSIVLIGECGLDKIRNADRMDRQKSIFKAQLELALYYHFPLIIHSVRTHAECDEMLQEAGFGNRVIFHGWNNKYDQAQLLIKRGYSFSFGKALLNPESMASGVIQRLPSDRILLETDDSKESIETIYFKAAQLLNMEKAQLDQVISENFSQFLQP